MLTLLMQDIRISNTFNAMYVDTVKIHSVHNKHTYNGMHVGAVNTIKLQCRF